MANESTLNFRNTLFYLAALGVFMFLGFCRKCLFHQHYHSCCCKEHQFKARCKCSPRKRLSTWRGHNEKLCQLFQLGQHSSWKLGQYLWVVLGIWKRWGVSVLGTKVVLCPLLTAHCFPLWPHCQPQVVQWPRGPVVGTLHLFPSALECFLYLASAWILFNKFAWLQEIIC